MYFQQFRKKESTSCSECAKLHMYISSMFHGIILATAIERKKKLALGLFLRHCKLAEWYMQFALSAD
jgi:hypothetical protein